MSQTQKHFSQAAQSYENHSRVQQLMAQELYDLTQPYIQAGRIMEYGVGTGHLSELLARDPRAVELEFVDFALPMLFQAQMKVMKTQTKAQTNFIEANIESHNLPTCASTYISNATIQWLEDFSGFVHKCADRLESGAVMALSAFGENHFDAFYQTAGAIFPEFNQRQVNLYSAQQLNEIARKAGFEVVHNETQVRTEYFDLLKDILAHIKQMGARDSSKAYALTPGRWRAWQSAYANFASGNESLEQKKLPLKWEYHLCVWKRI